MMYLWITLACVPGDLGMLEGALIPILSHAGRQLTERRSARRR